MHKHTRTNVRARQHSHARTHIYADPSKLLLIHLLPDIVTVSVFPRTEKISLNLKCATVCCKHICTHPCLLRSKMRMQFTTFSDDLHGEHTMDDALQGFALFFFSTRLNYFFHTITSIEIAEVFRVTRNFIKSSFQHQNALVIWDKARKWKLQYYYNPRYLHMQTDTIYQHQSI